MSMIDTLGSSIKGFAWQSMGQVVFVIVLAMALILMFSMFFLFIWYKSFNIKATIFKPLGQEKLSKEDIEKLKASNLPAEEKSKILREGQIFFDYTKKKITHGRHIKTKGNTFFQLFMPLRKLEPIASDYMFYDGVYLLQLSPDVYIPISRPKTRILVDENVSIAIADNNRWQVWHNLNQVKINNRFQDLDIQKKIVLYFVLGLVIMLALGAFILWAIYASSTKHLEGVDLFIKWANANINMGGGQTPPV